MNVPKQFEPRVRLNDDGSLANPRQEWLAMLLAETMNETDAWAIVMAGGGTATDGSRRYGKRVLANKTFIERREALVEEKTELEKDEIWGTVVWQTNQLYRAAVAEMDVKLMFEAVKLRAQITEKIAASRAPPAPPEEENPATKKGPGRPAAESTQTKGLAPEDIRAKLMGLNRQDPDLAEVEAEGEA